MLKSFSQISVGKLSLLIIVVILLIDQVLKYWIKTNLMLGQEIKLFGNWGLIHFTENNGMAFGLEFGGEVGKMILSIFRIIAVSVIAYYLHHLIKIKAPNGLVLCIALVLAGAIGNIIDSVFYGMLFSESKYYKVAEFLPESGGYSSFLHGKVVDMFYFPVINTTFPSWSPIKAGQEFIFFRPVFNVADSAISVGVSLLLIFQRKYFKDL
jgi:signal peptidase II